MTSSDKLLINPCAEICSDSDFDHANRSKSPWVKQKVIWYKPSERMPESGDDIIIYSEYDDDVIFFEIEREVYDPPSIHFSGDRNYWTYASNLNLPKD